MQKNTSPVDHSSHYRRQKHVGRVDDILQIVLKRLCSRLSATVSLAWLVQTALDHGAADYLQAQAIIDGALKEKKLVSCEDNDSHVKRPLFLEHVELAR